MKIYLAPVDETELVHLLPLRAALAPTPYRLTGDPAEADLILFLGSFGHHPERLLRHPLFPTHQDRAAVYTEDDLYLPLLPGVYTSAEIDRSSRAGRVFSFAFVSRSGMYGNPFVGGSEPPAKTLLFSFQGGSTSLLRKRMFNLRFGRPDVLIENTSTYFHWDLSQPGRELRQRRYAETLAASHFVLCPRGAGAGSIRLFEVMSAGVAPVLIADSYLLPEGVDWDSFLLRIPEREIGRLPELLEPHMATSAERGALALAAWQKHFSPEQEWNRIVDLALRALRHGPPAEAIFRRRQARLIAGARLRRQLRSAARNAVVGTLKLLHIRSPWQMNR